MGHKEMEAFEMKKERLGRSRSFLNKKKLSQKLKRISR